LSDRNLTPTISERVREQVSSRIGGAAIQPLPVVSSIPRDLRELELSEDGRDGLSDPAAVVRRLEGNAPTPEVLNDLGCAYARLAASLSSDEHWLHAIRHLTAVICKAREPSQATGEESELTLKARRNRERVRRVARL
jgi:hypothetical protein